MMHAHAEARVLSPSPSLPAMDKVLNYRNEIYGLCILWVTFFHIESVTHFPHYIPLLSEILRLGNSAVDIFLFLSGYCLSLSFRRHPNLGRYFRRRFMRIIIPYLLIAIPYFLWELFCESHIQGPLSMTGHFFFNLSGASFWCKGVQTTWFVHAIIAFYLVFPLLYHLVTRHKQGSWLLLGCIYAFIIVVHELFPSTRLSAIAYSRLPAFTLGIMMACHGTKLPTSPKAILLYAAYLFIAIYLFHVNTWLKTHCSDYFWEWMFFITLIIPSLFIIERFVHFSGQHVRKCLKFVGDMSLEVYLTHVTILHIICFYSYNKILGGWTYLILSAISLILAYVIYLISNQLVKSTAIQVK